MHLKDYKIILTGKLHDLYAANNSGLIYILSCFANEVNFSYTKNEYKINESHKFINVSYKNIKKMYCCKLKTKLSLNLKEYLTYITLNNKGFNNKQEFDHFFDMLLSKDSDSRFLAETVISKTINYYDFMYIYPSLYNYMENNLPLRDGSLEVFSEFMSKYKEKSDMLRTC